MSIFDIFKKSEKILKEEILRLAKNEITMERNTKQPAFDSCKIGGKPFLPADFVWPEFTFEKDQVTRPLSFFCQLNLGELARFDKDSLLPDHGLLSFFYECESFCWGFDPKDLGAAKVFYFEDTTGFIPFDIPETIDKAYIMPEMGVSLKVKQSYPMFEEFVIHSSMECEWEKYDKILEKLGVNTQEDPEGHKILGYADIIQDEMLSECEQLSRGVYCGDSEHYQRYSEDDRADIEEKAKDWTLLLQLGTIETEDFEWMFGDCGMLYFYIKKQDLAQRRFDKIWFSLQCG